MKRETIHINLSLIGAHSFVIVSASCDWLSSYLYILALHFIRHSKNGGLRYKRPSLLHGTAETNTFFLCYFIAASIKSENLFLCAVRKAMYFTVFILVLLHFCLFSSYSISLRIFLKAYIYFNTAYPEVLFHCLCRT